MFFWHGIFCQAIITKHYLMKTLKRILVVSLIAALANAAAVAQNSGRLPDGISNATRSGDADKLAKYFNNRVELVLPEKSGVFSREQAQFMMKVFFAKDPASSFQVIHQGEGENATFAIGRYSYDRGQFRLLFLIRNSDGRALIHQLRVEKQDE